MNNDMNTQDPYFDFVAEHCRQKQWAFPPWTTSDPRLLQLAKQYFPDIPLSTAAPLENPEITPVELLALQGSSCPALDDEEPLFITVGGPPAAAVALEAALQGKSVLWVSDQNCNAALPIWAGAGNHGEPDALTEGPAYIVGYHPLPFMLKESLRFLFPWSAPQHFLDPDYPWLNLNCSEWLRSPRQWLAGFRVAWGNYQLAKAHSSAMKQQGTSAVFENMKRRAHESGAYLEQLQQRLGGLLRPPRGSLLIAFSPQQQEGLAKSARLLAEEGCPLRSLTAEEAQQKYGIAVRGALSFMEKPQDFIFEANFLNNIAEHIHAHGGQVIRHWRLTRVFIDTLHHRGGVLEFCERTPTGDKKFHYKKFYQTHLSLGATPFIPNCYDLISVTGVSINALLFGVKLAGGPLVYGGTNHVVPLAAPQTVEYPDPRTGKNTCIDVSFVRLSAAGSVNPLDRGKNWYTYDGRHALHLLHRVQAALPEAVTLKILSVRGCNRVIGKDGHQIELHPQLKVDRKKILCTRVTIQTGAGGGGLTQMGAVPSRMAERHRP